MTHIEQAIKDAIEKGGYKETGDLTFRDTWFEIDHGPSITMLDFSFVFLDPSFWQALGKARGWERLLEGWATGKSIIVGKDDYRIHWHRFIDHLADGKDAENFFATLV